MDPGDPREEEERRPLVNKIFSLRVYEDDGSEEVQIEGQSVRKTSHRLAPAVVLGFECLESTAFFGMSSNLVVYLKTVLRQSNASSAANVNIWAATSYLTPLLGALIADTYWGNYQTVLISSFLYLIGLIGITFVALFPSPACEGISCQPASVAQIIAFFSSLYLVALGSGGVKAGLLPLGADQFDDSSPIDRENKGSFFNWFYGCLSIGVLCSSIVIVWIQENVDWAFGFGIAALCLALALGGLLLGTPSFHLRMPSGSPLKSILQVLIASFRKVRAEVPIDSSLLYEIDYEESNPMGRQRLAHTSGLRFLDKAATISHLDLDHSSRYSSWRVCTVTQVEELKTLIRLLPIWATGVIYSVSFCQITTTFIQQGAAMNTRIGSFSIPPASLSSMEVISVMLWISAYEKVVLPITKRFSCNGATVSHLQKMGVGLFLMIITMAAAAYLEVRRLQSVKIGEPISIAWQLPAYFIIGGSEVFNNISRLEFFYDQAPDSMKSLCTAFSLLNFSVGNYLSSFMVTVIQAITAAGGRPGWIPDDLNEGHLDYFFWCLTGLSVFNFVAYLAVTRKYTLKKVISEL